MSLVSGVQSAFSRVGAEFKSLRSGELADTEVSMRNEARGLAILSRQRDTCVYRAAVASLTKVKEPWATLTSNGWLLSAAAALSTTAAYTGTTQYIVGGASKLVQLQLGERAMMRHEVKVALTASGTQTVFIGASNAPTSAGPPSPDPNGFYIGLTISTTAVTFASYRGTNVAATSSAVPTGTALGVGSYIFTVVVDEENVNLSIQGRRGTATPATATVTIPRTAFPTANTGGVAEVINHLAFISTDTSVTATTAAIGPVYYWRDSAIPYDEDKVVGGINLFGVYNPLCYYRFDRSSGIRWLIRVPGQSDPRSPIPVVENLHWAFTGDASNPLTDSRWTSVTTGLDAAGYGLCDSDNGTIKQTTAPYTPAAFDQVGSPAALTDYMRLAHWYSDHYPVEQRFLVGGSGGGYPMWSLLKQRRLAAVSGVIGLSAGWDLLSLEQDPTYQTQVWQTWGATDHASWLTLSSGLRPAEYPGYAYRAVPVRLYYNTDDATVVPSVHTLPFIAIYEAKYGTGSVEQVSGTGGHLTASMFNISQWLTFFEKNRVSPWTTSGSVVAPVNPLDNSNLNALAGLVGATDTTNYFTALGTMALTSLTSFGRSLMAATSPTAARAAGVLDVYSRAEVDAKAIPTAEMGYAQVATTTTITLATTIGSTTSYISGLTTTVVGDGRPVVIRMFLPGVTHSTTAAGGSAYINMNDVLIQARATSTFLTGSPSNGTEVTIRQVLTAGTSYRFNGGVSFATGTTGNGSLIAGPTTPAEIHVTRC